MDASDTTADRVILVDGDDHELGTMPKLAVHQQGRLHRALSVFIFNSRGEMLLQRRAAAKYHSGGLWANACCSHPHPGEDVSDAARRRLREEMGISCEELEFAFAFPYRADVGGGLTEHEYDHVFLGRCDAAPRPDPREVAQWRWAATEVIAAELARDPAAFAAWFRLLFPRVAAHLAG